MINEQERAKQHGLLALSGAFVIATLVFALVYQFGAWLTHDKSISFLSGLILSLCVLRVATQELYRRLDTNK